MPCQYKLKICQQITPCPLLQTHTFCFFLVSDRGRIFSLSTEGATTWPCLVTVETPSTNLVLDGGETIKTQVKNTKNERVEQAVSKNRIRIHYAGSNDSTRQAMPLASPAVSTTTHEPEEDVCILEHSVLEGDNHEL